MFKIGTTLRLVFGVMLAFAISQTVYADAAFSLGGDINAGSPASIDTAALQAYENAHGATSLTVNGDTYTGVSLYGFLDSYITPGANKNDILGFYASATGAGGSTIDYSLGDLSGSGFGAQKDIIAISDNKNNLTGPAIIAADGASITNLTSLNVGHQPYVKGSGNDSTSLALSGFGITNTVFGSVASFQNLQQQQTIFTSVPQINNGALTSYTGLTLWNLLVQEGLNLNSPNLLNEYVVATGTDGYKAIFSLEEIDPGFGNEGELIAYATNGGSLGGSGEFRIIVPSDGKAGRYVSNLDSLTLFVPEPATLLLLLGGLCIPGLFGKRQSR